MKFIISLIAATALLAGCGSSTDSRAVTSPAPSTAAPPESPSAAPTQQAGVVIDIVFEDGKVTPHGARVEVPLGEPVTFNISSDTVDEVHVHSDPAHTYAVEPAVSVSETFTPSVPGQIAVEAHELNVTIVQLVVRP